MKQLSAKQRDLVSSLTKRLGEIPGIEAVVRGGSYARGRAQPDSDIDLGFLYSEVAPFSIERICELAREVNDTPSPVVTDFFGWGAWANGGTWLTIDGQRVDYIYRSLEQVERVIAEAEIGRHEVDYAQQPPFGFFSGTYLGEVAICIPLLDSDGRLDELKRRSISIPLPLKRFGPQAQPALPDLRALAERDEENREIAIEGIRGLDWTEADRLTAKLRAKQ